MKQTVLSLIRIKTENIIKLYFTITNVKNLRILKK